MTSVTTPWAGFPGAAREAAPELSKIGRADQDATDHTGRIATDWVNMATALDHYETRMHRVLDHIDRHLDGDLDLASISAVAAFSKFHFHRQFRAMFGLSLHRYVQLARLRRASAQLTGQAGQTITAIALDAGYGTPDAFTRAFRQRFGQSPSDFRCAPDWVSWVQTFQPLNTARSRLMQTPFTTDQVSLREERPIRVAIFEHKGDPAGLNDTMQKFISWRRANGLSPQTSPTFNVWYSERSPANPDDYHLELCVGVDPDQSVDLSDPAVRLGEIPGGRCAVLRVTGDTHNLEPAANFLYQDWLPASGEEMRDFPIYCHRFFLDDPEQGTGADLFLPLK